MKRILLSLSLGAFAGLVFILVTSVVLYASVIPIGCLLSEAYQHRVPLEAFILFACVPAIGLAVTVNLLLVKVACYWGGHWPSHISFRCSVLFVCLAGISPGLWFCHLVFAGVHLSQILGLATLLLAGFLLYLPKTKSLRAKQGSLYDGALGMAIICAFVAVLAPLVSA